jgi:hypothetical protein
MIKDLINKRNEICDKADKKEAQIERAQKLLRRYKEKSSWVETLLVPIAKAIVEKEGFFKFQTMGPFGLNCETSLWFFRRKEDYEAYRNNEPDSLTPIISIQFRPVGYNDENGRYRIGLSVTTHEKVVEYPAGSIGALNGFGKKQIDIDDWDLETLIAFMYDQNKKEGQ